MKILDVVKERILSLNTCSAAYLLAHAAWSACDHRKLPGPSALEISVVLDEKNTRLFFHLCQISGFHDYSNDDQAAMLHWLHEAGYSKYVAKQVKMPKKKLVDWV